jgi:hypothetical protein
MKSKELLIRTLTEHAGMAAMRAVQFLLVGG